MFAVDHSPGHFISLYCSNGLLCSSDLGLDEEYLFGSLYVTIHKLQGLDVPCGKSLVLLLNLLPCYVYSLFNHFDDKSSLGSQCVL